MMNLLFKASDNIIFIWMPVYEKGQVGHSSLRLSNGEYVSWWPQGKKAKCGPMQKKSKYSRSLQDDIKEERMGPDYIFNIPSTQLNLTGMIAYWNTQKSTGHYSLLEQNCCWVVYHVLRAGGAPMSQTIIWRPETLRRYLVIYLGGGFILMTYLNLPNSDLPFKEKITLYTWKDRGETKRHCSLLLDYSVYVSWWPGTKETAHVASSLHEDRRTIGREEDDRYTFPAEKLEHYKMRRHWKKMIEEDRPEMWGASSEWVIRQILEAGGASRYQVAAITIGHKML